MDADLRSRVWKIKGADKSLKNIIKKGDLLLMYGTGDTCGCVCLEKGRTRRIAWENAYTCEADRRKKAVSGYPVKYLSITGAMLSKEHEPFLLEAAMFDFADGRLRLYGELHQPHHVPEEPLVKRLRAGFKTAMKGKSKKSLKNLLSANSDLIVPGQKGPFGHASGQWHADPTGN